MAALLGSYIAEATARPFSIGEAHCLDFVARWIALACGLDARAAWGGPGAGTDIRRIMAEPHLMRSQAISAAMTMGLVETNVPDLGDVGLVQALVRGDRPASLVGAIRGEGLWYLKTGHGVLAADAPCEIAWSIAPVLLRTSADRLGRTSTLRSPLPCGEGAGIEGAK
jgi:hypothetical protein